MRNRISKTNSHWFFVYSIRLQKREETIDICQSTARQDRRNLVIRLVRERKIRIAIRTSSCKHASLSRRVVKIRRAPELFSMACIQKKKLRRPLMPLTGVGQWPVEKGRIVRVPLLNSIQGSPYSCFNILPRRNSQGAAPCTPPARTCAGGTRYLVKIHIALTKSKK